MFDITINWKILLKIVTVLCGTAFAFYIAHLGEKLAAVGLMSVIVGYILKNGEDFIVARRRGGS
jgi:hypothetical protein